ncbi:hypothetical protein [Aeromicrobium marinum]|uniref:hypothetical protein n=1 Tax=Aeromicrobium marinum TaxID=219314 RepID=UPI0001D015E8|nr:hypothetical protein [Aeromicrobium marinum]
MDPSELFRTMRDDPDKLGEILSRTPTEVGGWLAALEGADPHDWVDGLCSRHGERTRVLDALADMWVSRNASEAQAFVDDLETALSAGS